jgi:hypothetical protein
MEFWVGNGGKRLDALACARAKDDFRAVTSPNPTSGAADLDHLSRLDLQKPGGFPRIKPENLKTKSVSRQNVSGYEYTP